MMTTLFAVPNFGVLSKLALEHADGSRPAHVVRHENIDIDPNIVPGFDVRLAAGACEQFFGQSHRRASCSVAAGSANGFAEKKHTHANAPT
jgi:hypothetical protein